MKACDKVLFISSLISLCAEAREFSDSDMTGCKCKHELESGFISAGLGDTVVISAPIVQNCVRPVTHAHYLSNPKGDSTKLNINTTKITREYCTKTTQYAKPNRTEAKQPVVYESNEIRKFEKHKHILTDVDDYVTQDNEFTIGPLCEEDHGNWVLSTYYKTDDGDWTEIFRVITVEIVEPLPVFADTVQLIPGQTFEPRFLHPIDHLETCEIIKPDAISTGYFENGKHEDYDRFYDRDKFYMDFCGYRIPNVTKNDEGVWTIIAVAKIVYRGEVYLEVINDNEDL